MGERNDLYPLDACMLMGRGRAHAGPNYERDKQVKSGHEAASPKAWWEIPMLLRGMRTYCPM